MFHVKQMKKYNNYYCTAKDRLVTGELFSVYYNNEGSVAKTKIDLEEDMYRFYKTNNYNSHKLESITFTDKLYFFSRRAMMFFKYKIIKSLVKQTKLLDYGCGNGNFLAKFKAKKFGFEFNKSAKLNKTIKKLSLVSIKKEKYDLIIMRGVIEHIPNFDEVVKGLCKRLKKGGFFYITATPNTNNLTFLLSPKDFNQNDVRHIYHFNNVNLSMFFLQNNLFNIETVYQYANTPYAKYLNDFKFSKTQLRNFVSVNDIKSKSPPGVGNMITSIFKKMI